MLTYVLIHQRGFTHTRVTKDDDLLYVSRQFSNVSRWALTLSKTFFLEAIFYLCISVVEYLPQDLSD